MSTEITLSLPDSIYQHIETIAQATNRPIDELLTEAIRQAFPTLDINQNRTVIQDEVAAFEAMHAQLWQKYPHQFVAIYQGTVIDHDADEMALIQRIDHKYPEETVLIRRGLPRLSKILSFRSPHFEK